MVVARKIHSSGGEVRVFLLGDEARFKGAARKNFEIVSRMPIEMSRVSSIDSVLPEVLGCDAIVDAIFGTGLVRRVSGAYKDVIELINESQRVVFSVDIPSGINGNTGEVMGVGSNFPAAFAKASLAAGDRLPREGTVFVSVADAEKDAVILMALMLSTLGFEVLATEGTHRALTLNGIDSKSVLKHTVGLEMRAAREANSATGGAAAGVGARAGAGAAEIGVSVAAPITTVVDLIEAGCIDLVINIPRGRGARSDGYEIRRAALRRGVPTMTNAAAAHAAVQAIANAGKNREVSVTCLQDLHHRLAASAAGAGPPCRNEAQR